MRVTVLAALAAFTLSSANAAIVEEFKAADWDGLAFTSDETGAFTHCSVYASYRNGSTLYISYEAAQSWYFSVSNDAWTLGEGGNFAIKFKVDRRGEVEGTGVALAANQIGLPVEADHPFVSQLRRGNQLVITFQNQEYAFELSNSNRAMNAAQDCVRRHLAAGTRTPVVTQKPEQQQQATPAPAPAPAPAPEPAPEPESDTAADNTPPDAVAAGAQQEFGPWVVTATDDGAGTFVNCTAYGVHGDDQLILSLFPDGVWTFGLYRAAWNLDTNQSYYLWYNVDAPADAPNVTKRQVEAAETTRIFFEVSDLEDVIDRIENGSVLNLQFRGLSGAAEDFSYSLDRAPEAFAAVRQCVENQQPVEGVSKEGTGTKAEEPSTGPDEGAAEEETATGADEGTAEEETAEATDETTDQGVAPGRAIPVLGSTVIEEIEVPGWEAAALAEDDGTFSHCGIKADYQNGATLGVGRTANGDMLLVAKHADWSFEVGSWVSVIYNVKGARMLASTDSGQAVETSLVITNLGSGADVTETISGATELTIEAAGKTLAFDVSDIGPGITALDECVAKHASGSAPVPAPKASKKAEATPAPDQETEVAAADPSTDETPPEIGPDTLPPDSTEVASADAADAGEIRTEAAGYTTALLFRAGYPNHVILGADAEVPAEVPPGDAAWELGEVMGSTKVVTASATPDDLKSSVSGSLLSQCGGMLKTSIVTSDNAHMHFTLKCGTASQNVTHFLVLPRDAGGSYVFAFRGAVDDIAAGAIADAVYGTAVGS